MLEASLATFIDVVVPLNLNQMFTYRVPEHFVSEIEIGKRVAVQFGAKRIYAAIVFSVHDRPPLNYEAKYIMHVIDETPIIGSAQIKFWKWLSAYYMCSIGDVMNIAMPSGLKLESKTIIVKIKEAVYEDSLIDDKEFLILEALEVEPALTLDQVSDILQLKNVIPIVKSLHVKGLISIEEHVKERYVEKKINCIALNPKYESEDDLRALFSVLEKQEKQLNVLLAFLHLKQTHLHIHKSALLQSNGVSVASFNTLLRKEIFSVYSISVDRIKIDEVKQQSFSLNSSQEIAYNEITSIFDSGKPALLHGVTGSGKTHIYVKLIEQALLDKKQILFLLPEIALTTQIIQRIRKYFGDECIAFHSKFNQNERVEIWQKVLDGTFKIVIGARSALFLPFKSLGLIIVDEEHESSYKQQDPAPRYHARDAALYLAQQENAKIVLGSATPSFESYFLALQGKFGLVKLNKRYSNSESVAYDLADLTEETRTKLLVGNYFTSSLYAAINEALSKGEQVMLFQNRRGYAPVLECESCQWIPKCKNCDISLTYHKSIHSLKCHYCGYLQKVPETCGACGSPLLNFKGFGTEKIEDELQVLFPQASIGRLDFDAARTKHGHEQILTDFELQRYQILVGTQMITKGLDFANVTVGGIINADQLLFFPDFRAAERAFQLITQFSGRTGRREKRGKVIIQSKMPNHAVLQAAVNHEYVKVYETDLEDRRRFNYPPFTRLIKIVLKHKEYKVCELAGVWLSNWLNNHVKDIQVLGPETPYVGKIRNLFIKEILIKIPRQHSALAKIKQHISKGMTLVQTEKQFKSVIIYADVDPY